MFLWKGKRMTRCIKGNLSENSNIKHFLGEVKKRAIIIDLLSFTIETDKFICMEHHHQFIHIVHKLNIYANV